MKSSYRLLYAALLAALATGASAQQVSGGPVKTLGTVTVTGGRPTSLPTQIPTTIEGVTGEQVEDTINATDSEDALKYLPSLLVRKRYIGDYDHAVLASRASGTGNSARSLVYADGILLSNLLGNGASFTPRWGLVTPEEIERVDVLYGPFSAAYPGNSVGAVVDYLTRMPTKFEGHAKLTGFTQSFQQYGADDTYSGHQASASLGNRNGNWFWWLNVNRLDSDGQPLVFATRLVSAGTASGAGTPVTGAIADKNPQNRDWWILGATNQVHTIQDHAKAKLAYDFSPTLRASYTLGWWQNEAKRTSQTYLHDAAGKPVYSGNVNIGGRQFALTPADFAPSNGKLEHVMHGLSVKSNIQGVWDWEVAASLYDYAKDQVRTPTTALPAASAGRITDMGGTGWHALSLKGTWRPDGAAGAHIVDMGYQRENYKLRTLVSDTPDWLNGGAAARFSAFNGNSALQSLYLQDTWRFAPAWRATLGGRLEEWHAYGGEIANASSVLPFVERKETHFSPKAAIAYQVSSELALKASLGRAVRMPTVAELYQGSISTGTIVNNDPNLRPEKSWTSEWTVERDLGNGLMRATLFHENTRDALYSQTNVTVTPSLTNIQNVDEIHTSGLELAYQANDIGLRGLDLNSSLTYADSTIAKNAKFPASVGKWQPRVPKWRANLLATYRANEKWTHTLGLRYSGRQYGTLDNSDPNGFSYTGVSKFLVADVRMHYRVARQWSLALGIDNLNNYKYWAFHPYTQRTVVAELKFSM
ncbi:TonB-dependent receptor [Noviherbaspirillum saxi]|uniref:TonB-dependent receptor n=1 Tax=Noviherbaspirillum saxi TaxID=2320863 RepID=A0A3A3FHZ7_9BURK|nr:TonB-dependent receptor [Noviherbaspirillum saxi]RJF92018.1 TonB-dependent receptor [Noviherbaspirillum saxi]